MKQIKDIILEELEKTPKARAVDISRKYNRSQKLISKILGELLKSGILEKERYGISVYYKLADKRKHSKHKSGNYCCRCMKYYPGLRCPEHGDKLRTKPKHMKWKEKYIDT